MSGRPAWLPCLAALLVASCATRRLHGQVVVVAEDGTRVSLAHVRLLLFREEAILARVANRDQAFEAALARARDENAELARTLAEADTVEDRLEALRTARLQAEWKQTESGLAAAAARARKSRKDAQEAARLYADAHDRRMAAATPEQIAKGAVEAVEERRRMEALSEAADRAEAAVSSLAQKSASLKAQLSVTAPRASHRPLPEPRRTSQMYFEDLPAPTLAVETDADGHFSLLLPGSGRWVIAAHAERRRLGTVENDYWMIRVPAGGEDDMLLSDTCRTNSGSTRSIVRVEDEH